MATRLLPPPLRPCYSRRLSKTLASSRDRETETAWNRSEEKLEKKKKKHEKGSHQRKVSSLKRGASSTPRLRSSGGGRHCSDARRRVDAWVLFSPANVASQWRLSGWCVPISSSRSSDSGCRAQEELKRLKSKSWGMGRVGSPVASTASTSSAGSASSWA